MTRPFDKHLDNDELDGLVLSRAASVTISGRLSEETLGEVRRHVESCQDCSRKVQMHKSVQSEISRMGVPSNVLPGPGCITGVEWVNVAAGLLPEVKTRALMKHAAQCGHCGPLLRSATETLGDEIAPSEEDALEGLDSAGLEWQTNMARRLRALDSGEPIPSVPDPVSAAFPNTPSWRFAFLKQKWQVASLISALCLVIIISSLSVRRHRRATMVTTEQRQSIEAPSTSSARAPSTKATQTGSPPPESPSGSGIERASELASFVLEPGLTRGLEGYAPFKLLQGGGPVNVTLLFIEPPPNVLHIELLNFANQVLWAKDLKLAETAVRRRQALVRIPPGTIVSGDYRIIASQPVSDGLRGVATYAFHVTK